MTAPVNPDLSSMADVDKQVDANHELYAVSYHFLVKKGVDIEDFLASMIKGDFQNGTKNLGDYLGGIKVVDVTKI